MVPISLLLIFLILISIIVYYVLDYWIYIKSQYFLITHNPLYKTVRDDGLYGEYLTYKYLKQYEKQGGKFLFNVYIPKANGRTTEIDIILIIKNGIYVFESKNYSGWIYGSDNQTYWTQTLPAGRKGIQKSRFYNPIMQNRSHIKHLKEFLKLSIPFHSIIVFSERCVFQNLKLCYNDYCICYRDTVKKAINDLANIESNELLTDSEIQTIYDRLYPFTQTTAEQKKAHINQNKKYYN